MSDVLGRIDFAAKRKTIRVYIPEFQGNVILRELGVGHSFLLKADPDNLARELIYAIVDEDGNQIYQDTPEDIANMNGMSLSVSNRLFKALAELHQVTMDTEEIKKNLKPTTYLSSGLD